MKGRIRKARTTFALAAAAVFAASTAHAVQATGMPWETPMNAFLSSLARPTSRVIGAVAIIGVGLGMAFSEGGSVLRKALWVVLGLSIAYSALSWGLTFVGFGGGLLL